MKLKNDIGLIGDFLGTIPVMVELAKVSPLEVDYHWEIKELFSMIPSRYNIMRLSLGGRCDESLDLGKAFKIAEANNYHMTQAHFAVMGLPVPDKPVRPQIEIHTNYLGVVDYDYVLSPFSRSLPDNQKWARRNWQDLVDEMPDRTFALIGAENNDQDIIHIDTKNVTRLFGKEFKYVCAVLRRSTFGLLSVVTGTSHLAYATDVKNFLITNQKGAWGNNPEAVRIDDPIPELSVSKVARILRNHEDKIK